MKRTFLQSSLKLAAMTVCLQNAYAQTWEWQNPRPQGNHMNDIQAVTSTIAYAVGDLGVLLKSIDGGTNWKVLPFPNRMNIWKIQFLNERLGWVGGYQNNEVYLYKTNDGAKTWTQQFADKSKILATYWGQVISFDFLNADFGWVSFDSTLLHTEDGGLTWRTQKISGPIARIQFIDERTGWLVGYAQVYRTVDGGKTWNVATLWNNNDFFRLHLTKVRFVNPNVGWCIGTVDGPNTYYGHLYKSVDGGKNWQEQKQHEWGFDLGIYNSFTDLEFQDENRGWAVAPGRVFQTNDGGNNWRLFAESRPITQVVTIDQKNFSACGTFGALFTSNDSGATWNERSSGTSFLVHSSGNDDLFAINEKTVFAAGTQNLIKTSNGGETWEKIEFKLPRRESYLIQTICFLDSLRGFLGTGRAEGAGLFKTVDGGRNWEVKLDSTAILELFFFNDSLGWAGSWNKIYYTSDGGNTWKLSLAQNKIESVNSIFFTTPDSGWCAGYLGIMRTINGGKSWVATAQNDLPFSPEDIFFINSQVGWITGYSYATGACVIKTADGGLTWEQQLLPSPNEYWTKSVFFTDRHHGWMVGFDLSRRGRILYTADGGERWNYTNFPSEHFLYKIRFAGNYGWILGANGTILRLRKEETVAVETHQLSPRPENFVLYENYPNPFYPATNIRYYLPRAANVQVVIYDQLGRTLQTLVDGVQQAGEHALSWDGKNRNQHLFASGIYFCTLKIEGHTVATKQMLRLK